MTDAGLDFGSSIGGAHALAKRVKERHAKQLGGTSPIGVYRLAA